MAYKILGTKNEAARVIIFKESDWSIESNTVVAGSGAYEIDSLETESKLIVAESGDGELLGYGNVTPIEYAEPQWYSYHDNTFWVSSVYETPNGEWVGGSDWWAADYKFGYNVRIVPTGGWETAFRPTKMRVTWISGNVANIYLSDAYAGNIICAAYNKSTGFEIDLDFDAESAGDIAELYMSAADMGEGYDFEITNIEFYY